MPLRKSSIILSLLAAASLTVVASAQDEANQDMLPESAAASTETQVIEAGAEENVSETTVILPEDSIIPASDKTPTSNLWIDREPEAKDIATPQLLGGVFESLVWIGIFAAIIWSFLRWKRGDFQRGREGGAPKSFKILERNWMNRNVQIVVAEFNGERMLLAIGPNRVNRLDTSNTSNSPFDEIEAFENAIADLPEQEIRETKTNGTANL